MEPEDERAQIVGPETLAETVVVVAVAVGLVDDELALLPTLAAAVAADVGQVAAAGRERPAGLAGVGATVRHAAARQGRDLAALLLDYG